MLAKGAYEHRMDSDREVSSLSPEWPIDRQPAVDRNILRLALFEIECVDSIPDVVSVNEAIDMAKKYSTEDSGKFVNGVLAAYLRAHGQREDVQQDIQTED